MLEGVGLDAEQDEVYRELIARPRWTVDELVGLRPDRSPQRIREVVRSLVDLGFAVYTDATHTTYAAIAPDVAVPGLVRARIDDARRAEHAVPELMAAFWAGRQADPVDFFELVTDQGTLMERWYRLQDAVQHEVRAFDCPPYLADPLEPDPAELERLAHGIAYRVIYADEVLRVPGRWADLEAGIAAGEQARVAPQLPAKLTLFDDFVAVMPVRRTDADRPTAAVVVHRSPLLDALSALFERYWERAVPIVVDADGALGTEPPAQSAVDEARLIRLLAAGLGDNAIQRALGVSASTVQRRVRGLMVRLGATSRFQAGLLIGRMSAESAAPDNRATAPATELPWV
jgi:hypothetical protein